MREKDSLPVFGAKQANDRMNDLDTLIWKLTLVPVLVAAVTLVGRYFGQSIAGWLGSFPIVVGPILWVLTLEQGGGFLAQAAVAALAGVLPAMVFFVAYARAALHGSWPRALALGLIGWGIAVVALGFWQQIAGMSWMVALVLAVFSLVWAPYWMPRADVVAHGQAHCLELPARMLAGVVVTLISSELGRRGGPAVSGYASLFPSVGIIVASFNHAQLGPSAALHFLKGMTFGMWSVASFCLTLALLGERYGLGAFAVATAVAVATHAINRWRQRRSAAD